MLLATIAFLMGFTSPTAKHPLDSLRGRNRVLLVFGPNSLDDRTRAQLAMLDGKAMSERDLILVPELKHWNKGDEDLFLKGTALNTDEEQGSLRRRFHVDPSEFTVILLGKDGDEKFRSQKPITMEKLIQLIDAMPMRQQEMKSRPPR